MHAQTQHQRPSWLTVTYQSAAQQKVREFTNCTACACLCSYLILCAVTARVPVFLVQSLMSLQNVTYN